MDLSTTYMGLKLKHPIVPSASPLSKNLDGIRKMEDAGAPAVVMYSLFEEQIEWESRVLDHYLSYGSESFAEATSYYPDLAHYNVGPDEYLNLISKAKAATSIPIIGSLNGVSTGGWIEYAHKIQEAGADAIELNLYYIATDLLRTGAEVEQMYLDVVRDVKKTGPSRSRSNSAHSSVPPQIWPIGWPRRAPTHSSCSTVSTSRTSSWNRWK